MRLPDGSHISSSRATTLAIPNVPTEANQAHVLPSLRHQSLLSVGQLCDHGCIVTFSKHNAEVRNHANKLVLTGARTPPGLWKTMLPVQHTTNNSCNPPATEAVNASIETSTKEDLIAFLHATAFSPVPSTFIKAIQRGHFATWPGLTAEAVRKHLPKSIATTLGHLDQSRKNQRSTKQMPTKDDDTEVFAPQPAIEDGRRTHHAYTGIIEYHPTEGKVFTDLTGRFPVQSAQGNKYLLVLYDYDSNSIHALPMKNRSEPEMIRVYDKIYTTLTRAGLRPRLQRMDNETSSALKTFLHDKEATYQLVPPDQHRRNAAERAIRTFKNHFVAGLNSTDPNFPMRHWDRLIHQANITLNLLRSSRINPKLSAYAQVFGLFDFNATPMAPPGTRAVIHVKPKKHGTWASHGEVGWYIGPAPEHYRCYTALIDDTQSTRVTDTIEFFPSKTNMPRLSSQDAAIRAAQELTAALQHPHPAMPIAPLSNTNRNALKQLATIFEATLPRVGATEPLAAPANNKPASSSNNIAGRTRSAHNANAIIATETTPQADLHAAYEEASLQHSLFEHVAMANAVVHPTTGKPMEYRELRSNPDTKAAWDLSAANEFGRLAQGIRDIKGTNTISFITKDEITNERRKDVTYVRYVCTYRPQKSEPNRTRITAGGDRVNYPGQVSTETAEITTVKALINSTLSKPKGKFCCFDVKNFYLGTPMDRPEYARVHRTDIPQEIIDAYNLEDKFDEKGYVFIRIDRGMYGLPQAGFIANKQLEKFLGRHGYYKKGRTPGLWGHITRPIQFALIVDDFGVEYERKEDADHLLAALKGDYEAVSSDWSGTLFCGITLKWDYKARTCDLSMPDYVAKALHEYQHSMPRKREDSPHPHNIPQYGVKVQMTDPIDDSTPLDDHGKKFIQKVCGKFQFYACAVDSTMLVALSDIATQQSKATVKTLHKVTQFLNYAASNPNAELRFVASDMQLKIHTDASYLNHPGARSRTGSHHYYGNRAPKPDSHNGAILNQAGILRMVVASAMESEVGGLYVGTKQGVILRQTSEDLGWPQDATDVTVDNTAAEGIINESLKPQRSRAIDMRFYWVRDRIHQGQFNVNWAPGTLNKADYFTKHFPASHHREVRPVYLHIATANAMFHSPLGSIPLRGCAIHPVARHPDVTYTREIQPRFPLHRLTATAQRDLANAGHSQAQ